MNYEINIQEFQGPLDLLLHLISKNEIDIFDIPISKITEQYINYINQFKEYNIELSSEFIVMAAQLIQIKSKSLLPPEEDDHGDEIDPREELAQKLYEYRIFKEISGYLKDKEQIYLKIFYKDPEYIVDETPQVTKISINQLTKAFKRVITLNNIILESKDPIHKIEREEIRLEDKIIELHELFKVNDKMLFDNLFIKLKTKQNIIVTFLAVLQLIKNNVIGFEQNKTCNDIILFKL